MATFVLTSHEVRKLRNFLSLVQISATYKATENFKTLVSVSDKQEGIVNDFFKIDFRKKDADYQQKMLILNYNAQYPNN